MCRSVACINYKDGKVFIAKRKNGGDMSERWEFPGGKLENGEDCIVAIKREMLEEFNVNVEVGRHITDGEFEHNGKKCYLSAYEVRFLNDDINKVKLVEHTQFKWVDLNAIPTLKFVDSDLRIYPTVKEWCEKQND